MTSIPSHTGLCNTQYLMTCIVFAQSYPEQFSDTSNWIRLGFLWQPPP